jgi:hypothetical protein
VLAVVTWKWGKLFSHEFVNRMRNMLERHLHVPHRMLCLTDDRHGIDHRVECLPLPIEFAGSFRCRRRMWQYSEARRSTFGPRFLSLDLDNILTDDITPLVERPEPLVMFRVGYANTLSGSFVLCDTGYLHGAYEAYAKDPVNYPRKTGLQNASDQAMLNMYLRGRRVAQWKERDGFCVFFGKGYERLEYHGVGPNRPNLPQGTRVVVLGSDDLWALEDPRFAWREHWR